MKLLEHQIFEYKFKVDDYKFVADGNLQDGEFRRQLSKQFVVVVSVILLA